MEILVGTKAKINKVVSNSDTALALGSGGVNVFSTPSMIALMENAALEAIRPFLEDGFDSVGTKISVSHLSATPVGMGVYAEAEVTEVERKKVILSVKAFDEAGLIGEGTHERFIINLEKFIEKANSK